jgi:acetylornithine/succinyldiaminopimelate/putrescine aminotransferase
VVRLAPPLVIERAQVDEAVAALGRVLARLGQRTNSPVAEPALH